MLKNGKQKCSIRSIRIAPFLDEKIIRLLKADKKKVKIGQSEFNGNLNPYIISLIRADLKARSML